MKTEPQNNSNKNWPQWRTDLHNIIFEADTPAGKGFDVILLILIVVSILAVMMETVESFDAKYHNQIVAVEWFVTLFFTAEYIARIISIKKPKKYIFSFYGFVDLFSTLPTYLSLFFVGSHGFIAIRALRLLRVFRILKLVRFSNASSTIIQALIASRYKIIVFIISVITLVTIIGSFMYLIESPTNESFTSIPDSIYWAIVTLTTVGYGDISPITPLGKFLASVIMILGYGIIAVPTGIVTTELANAENEEAFEQFNQSCISCGAENHTQNANYCWKCGHSLLE